MHDNDKKIQNMHKIMKFPKHVQNHEKFQKFQNMYKIIKIGKHAQKS